MKKTIEKHKWKFLGVASVVIILVVSFFFTGVKDTDSYSAHEAFLKPVVAEVSETDKAMQENTSVPEVVREAEKIVPKEVREAEKAVPKESEKADNNTGSVTVEKPAPVEPQDTVITDNKLHSTVSISCAAILDNLDLCDETKRELVPADGWILKPTEVTFSEGESVFDVLKNICQERKIHMEFEDSPMYNSAYIEGIANIYESDVGALSGWMYSVNGWFPNYGCSRYQLKDGDVICWVFTCNFVN